MQPNWSPAPYGLGWIVSCGRWAVARHGQFLVFGVIPDMKSFRLAALALFCALICLGVLARPGHADGPQSPVLVEPPKSPQPPSPASTSFPGVDPDGRNGLPRSQRVVNYNIDASWNPPNKPIT